LEDLLRNAALVGTALAGLLLAGCGGSTAHPAATVNGHGISMATYNKQVTYKVGVSAQSIGNVDPCKVKNFSGLCHKLKQTVLNDLINEEIVREYARNHGITVAQAEVDTAWNNVFVQKFHRDQRYLKTVASGLGMTRADFKRMVGEGLLQQRVLYQVTRQMSTFVPAVRLARIVTGSLKELKGIEQRLKNGENFEQVALSLNANKSTQCAQVRCGELGWIPDAFVPAQQRNSVTSVAPGSVVGPFTLQNGVFLLEVENSSLRYRMTPQQEISMRQRVFAQWLAVQQKKARIQKYAVT